jgi:membrane peptidoglycan carboxypeptidase
VLRRGEIFLRNVYEEWSRQLRVPVHFIELLVLIEDKRFLHHSGVDSVAILRALHHNLKCSKPRQGGSTIPQQLYAIRASAAGTKYRRNVLAKLQQAIFGVSISRSLLKRQILAEYLAGVYWGKTYIGLDAAAKGYFNKLPMELDVAESFFLAERLACPNRVSIARLKVILARKPIRQSLDSFGSSVEDIEGFYHDFSL